MKNRSRSVVNVARLTRRDPTRTATVLRAHVSALRRQFADLRGRIAREFAVGGRFAANTFNPDQPRDELGRFLATVTTEAIKELSAKYAERQGSDPGLSPEDINEGYCSWFAHAAVRLIQQKRGREVTVAGRANESDDVYTSRSEQDADGEGHMWVTVAGRHYDAERPEGVDDPKHLPWFRRHPGFEVYGRASPVKNAFNPDQPRNPDGTFAGRSDGTSVSGGGIHEIGAHELLPRGHIETAKHIRDQFNAKLDAVTDVPVLRQLKGASRFCKTLTGKMYTKLAARYGKPAAVAIMASGQAVGWGATIGGAIVGVPIVLPGSSLWGAIPGAALAETILQAARLAKRVLARNAAIDVDKLGSEFWEELVGGYKAYLTKEHGWIPVTYNCDPDGDYWTGAGGLQYNFDPNQPRDERGRWLSPTHFMMDDAIHSSANLSDSQKDEYSRGLNAVMSKMTPTALARVGRAVKSVVYHASPRKLTEAFAVGPPPSAKAQSTLDRGKLIGGAFNPKTGKLTLDGAGLVMPKAGGASSLSAAGSKAHELGHALDFGGPNDPLISSTPAWKAAWEKELKDGRISNYAGHDEMEGFAEFSRLVHATKLTPAQVAGAYPMCAAVWRHHGILA